MNTEISFEKALEKLEKIVEDLEAGNISLDEALKKYEEGVKLSRACQQKLVQAEKKIKILTQNLDGSFKEEDFNPDEAEEPAGKKASGRKKGKVSSGGESKTDEDEDLLI